MAQNRKVRRVRRPQATTTPPARSQDSGAPATPGPAVTRARNRKTTEEDLRTEYAYVLRDLRRVFIIAAAMFLLLIVLNLVLRL